MATEEEEVLPACRQPCDGPEPQEKVPNFLNSLPLSFFFLPNPNAARNPPPLLLLLLFLLAAAICARLRAKAPSSSSSSDPDSSSSSRPPVRTLLRSLASGAVTVRSSGAPELAAALLAGASCRVVVGPSGINMDERLLRLGGKSRLRSSSVRRETYERPRFESPRRRSRPSRTLSSGRTTTTGTGERATAHLQFAARTVSTPALSALVSSDSLRTEIWNP